MRNLQHFSIFRVGNGIFFSLIKLWEKRSEVKCSSMRNLRSIREFLTFQVCSFAVGSHFWFVRERCDIRDDRRWSVLIRTLCCFLFRWFSHTQCLFFVIKFAIIILPSIDRAWQHSCSLSCLSISSAGCPPGSFLPRRIDELCGKAIRDISCGIHHVVALTEEGKIFSWGSQNSFGELGNGLGGFGQ